MYGLELMMAMRFGGTVIQEREKKQAGRKIGSVVPAAKIVLISVIMGIFALGHGISAAKDISFETTVAKSARLGGDIIRTRFVADLSRRVNFRIFTLSDPFRVVVDLPNVKFQIPPSQGRKGRGLVRSYRYGLIAPGKSRIVIDVTQPVRIDKSFVLERQSGQPARLVVDLVPTDLAAFAAQQSKARKKQAALLGREGKKGNRQTRMVPFAGSKSGKDKPVIVIDPGHGGIDPGAISSTGAKEKHIVFSFSQLLEKRLKATGQYRVYLTRTIDTFVALNARVSFARERKADLLISIHADSLPRRHANGVRGATVYTLSEKASDKEARLLAHKENQSDIIAGVELPKESSAVTNILINLMQRETKNNSIAFASTLLKVLKMATRLNKEMPRFANFRVLRAPDVPSVLVELGFLSSKKDEKLLKSKKWKNLMVDLTTGAINNFFSKRIARSPY